MKLIWVKEAKLTLLETADYIQKEFGRWARRKFMQEVHRVETLLRDNPNLGPVEPLLEGHAILYRSIVVNRLNKIVYCIADG